MLKHKNAPRGAYPRPARRNPVTDCPLTAAFAAVGGKWKLIIIYWLSQKVLTEQRRELAADEIVRREPRGAVPQPVMYRLTEYGRSLLPLVEVVRAWGRGHIERTLSRVAKASAS